MAGSGAGSVDRPRAPLAQVSCRGTYDSIEALGVAIDMHPKVIRSRIKLAFTAPDLTKSLLTQSMAAPLQVTQFIESTSNDAVHREHKVQLGPAKLPVSIWRVASFMEYFEKSTAREAPFYH